MKYLAQDVRQFLAGNLRLAELDAQPERVVLRPEIEQERLGAIRSRWAFLSAGLPSFVPGEAALNDAVHHLLHLLFVWLPGNLQQQGFRDDAVFHAQIPYPGRNDA